MIEALQGKNLSNPEDLQILSPNVRDKKEESKKSDDKCFS